QTRVRRGELPHRKTLDGVAAQESVDEAVDVVEVGRDLESDVRELSLERGVYTKSRLGPEARRADRVCPARGVEDVGEQLLNCRRAERAGEIQRSGQFRSELAHRAHRYGDRVCGSRRIDRLKDRVGGSGERPG